MSLPSAVRAAIPPARHGQHECVREPRALVHAPKCSQQLLTRGRDVLGGGRVGPHHGAAARQGGGGAGHAGAAGGTGARRERVRHVVGLWWHPARLASLEHEK